MRSELFTIDFNGEYASYGLRPRHFGSPARRRRRQCRRQRVARAVGLHERRDGEAVPRLRRLARRGPFLRQVRLRPPLGRGLHEAAAAGGRDPAAPRHGHALHGHAVHGRALRGHGRGSGPRSLRGHGDRLVRARVQRLRRRRALPAVLGADALVEDAHHLEPLRLPERLPAPLEVLRAPHAVPAARRAAAHGRRRARDPLPRGLHGVAAPALPVRRGLRLRRALGGAPRVGRGRVRRVERIRRKIRARAAEDREPRQRETHPGRHVPALRARL